MIENLGSLTPGTGTGALTRIDKISDGRITNIVVDDGGFDFLEENLPIVVVKNYDYYIN